MQILKTFIGEPCKHGHSGERYIKNRVCRGCALEKSKKWRGQPGKTLYLREYHKRKGPNQKLADRERHRRWRKTENGRKATQGYYFVRMYGITLDQIDLMVEKQKNSCAICKKPGSLERYGRLSVDHDHVTGLVRELLCDDCNVGLGQFSDDPARMEAAAAYLRRHGKG